MLCPLFYLTFTVFYDTVNNIHILESSQLYKIRLMENSLRRTAESFMKKFTIIPLILILFICLACETKQKGPSHLKVGTDKLIESGLAVEAVNLLIEAEKREDDKAEPRALLVIAYSHALASGATRGQDYESEYKRQRAERIAALNDAEMNKMIDHLKKRSQVQQNGFQALVDKGTDAATLLIDHIVQGTYPNVHGHFISVLVKMKSKAVDPILNKITDTDISPAVKMKLIRVLGDIGDKKAMESLKSIDMTNLPAALKMEIYTTLYILGENKYKSEILAGLTVNQVEVRRAAAKAMANLKVVKTSSLIKALKDEDSQVVIDIAKALAVHRSKEAVEPLVNVLKSDHSMKAAQEVLNTLTVYVNAGGELKKGIARRIALLLIEKEVSSTDVRIMLASFLKGDMLVRQLKAASLLDGLDSKLYDYAQTEESSTLKSELNELLTMIKR